MSEYARLVISVDSTQAKKADKDLGALEKSASSLTSGLGKLIGPLVSVATAMAALNKASDVQRQFDVLNSGLITATGSSEKAAVAFKALQQFAQKTPYDLNQAVKGFTQLVNLGLNPSEKAMTSYGNTASAMGYDLSQMIEAVADATTGEFERLKAFGIKAKVNGDQISLIFQGVTTKIGNNAAEIEKYLIGLGETKFGGGMSLRMKTLDGEIAGLADTWDTTFRLINEAGLGEAMRDSVNLAAEALNELNSQIASGELETQLSAVAGKFDGFGKDIEFTLSEISKLFVDNTGFWGRTLDANVANMTATFRDFPENVRAMIQVMTIEVLAGFDKVKAYARAFNDGINAIFTGDTFEGVGARLEAELNVASAAREGSLQSIFDEREAALSSFAAQTQAAKDKRKVFEDGAVADAANTSDRLAQFKALTDGSTSSSAAADKAAKAAATLAAQQAKALKDLLAQNEISVNSSNAMTDAYLAGADSVRELTIQQKVEEELLKTGAAARDAVTSAVNREVTAKDRLDIAQSIASMRTETTQTLAQATATLQGKTALEAFNIQKSMSIALSGKNIEYGSQEYELLLQQTKAQLEANKALEQANSVESIIDRLNPQIKLLRDYTSEQDALNAAIAQGTDKTPLYQDALAKLGLEYEQNKAAATAWGQFTQGAVDRVDDAFADAWKNIDKGFKGFADNLVGGFKQLLAELAHMAITKPIIMQIGASLGVGGLASSAAGGSGGGGIGIGSVLNGASTAYGAVTGWGKAIYTGYQSGGISGAASGLGNYAGGLFSGADQAAGQAIGTVANGGSMTYAPLSYQASNGSLGAGAAQGATTYAPWAAAIGGAIMGYQNSGVKGAVAGAAGGFAGAKGGAALGSYFGPIGTAVGAVIGGILGAVGGSKLFGGDWITKDQGIQLSVDKGDFVGNQFEYQKKKGGLFSSNKKRTNLTSLDPEMQKALDDSYAGTLGAVLGVFDSLNVELNDGVLDGLNVAATQISTKDKTAEEIQAELMTWFTDLGDAAVSAVSDATGAGVGNYDFSQLQVFAGNLLSINDTFKLLNVNALPVSVWGGKLAEQYVAMAGGMEAFNSAAQSYYSNFFTETEQADDVLQSVTDQFAALGITLPSSREGFRAMVQGIDSTTDAGRSMYTTLIGLNGNAASAYTILEGRAKEAEQATLDLAQSIKDGLFGAVSTASSSLSRAVEAERDSATKAYNARVASLNDMSATAAQSVTDLSTVSNSLESALKSLNGTSDDAVKTLRAQAQATLQSALATARAGGSLSGFTGLEDALSTVSDNNTDLYSSMEDFARDQGRTANVVAELNAINGKQLTAAEKLQEGLETQIEQAKEAYDAQMAQYDQQLAFAQAQMDALNGVDNSVMSVTAAINAMNSAVVAALAGISGKASAGTSANNGTLINSVYQDVLGRGADAAGAAYWQGQLASGAIGYDQLEQAIKNAAVANGSIPAYATGGDHMGGLRLVGENGPELEVTGPSRIFNANQTAAMLKGGGDSGAMTAQIQALRKEVESNATYMAQLNKRIADGIDTLVNSGVQILGTVDTKAAV